MTAEEWATATLDAAIASGAVPATPPPDTVERVARIFHLARKRVK